MATRSTTSEFQPSPPNTRLRAQQVGMVGARPSVHDGDTTTRTMNPGPNVCTAPTGGTTKARSIRNGVG